MTPDLVALSRGAHLLLQVRTKVINDELDQLFRGWHPHFREAAAA
jgi:hypothetical protein